MFSCCIMRNSSSKLRRLPRRCPFSSRLLLQTALPSSSPKLTVKSQVAEHNVKRVRPSSSSNNPSRISPHSEQKHSRVLEYRSRIKSPINDFSCTTFSDFVQKWALLHIRQKCYHVIFGTCWLERVWKITKIAHNMVKTVSWIPRNGVWAHKGMHGVFTVQVVFVIKSSDDVMKSLLCGKLW